jgi:cell division protein FtsL
MKARRRIANALKSGCGKASPSRWTYVLFRPKAPTNRRTNSTSAAEEQSQDVLSPRGPETIGTGYLALLCLIVCGVVFAFVYHLHVRFEGIELGYATSAARSKQSHLVLERQELRLELASLKSPSRVEAEAREHLGMDVPGHDRIVVIGEKHQALSVSGGAL